MSNQWKNRFVILAVSILIFSFSIRCFIKPADKISLSERRPLQQFPKLTADTLLSGKFMKEFDDYAVDQFPLRESFRRLYSGISLDLLRKSDLEGLYFKNDSVIAMEYPMNEASLEHASKVFQRIYETCLKGNTENIYLSIIPYKNYFLQKDPSVLAMDYPQFFQTMQNENPQMHYIDITSLLDFKDYYQTDPHWRQEHLTDVAKHLADSMGVTITEDFDKHQFTKTFRGAYAEQSARSLSGEPLYYLTNPAIEKCHVFDHQNNREISMYDFEKGEGRDPYELFLSGSLSYITIENPSAQTNRELIIFRDSFGSSIAPFLATGYKKITLLDIRYLPSYSLPSLIDFKSQDVLFLYSTSVLNHSETLK